MDSIALQLAIKYATKSGKLTLAQKITDELLEGKPQREQQKPIERRPSPVRSTTTHQTTFEAPRPAKVATSAGPFANPFRKKVRDDPPPSSTTDELSEWKPSIGKTRLPTSTKLLPQVREEFAFVFATSFSFCLGGDQCGKRRTIVGGKEKGHR